MTTNLLPCVEDLPSKCRLCNEPNAEWCQFGNFPEQHDEIEKLLTRIQYKPGWRVYYNRRELRVYFLSAELDATRPEEPTAFLVSRHAQVPKFLGEKDCVAWLQERFHEWELHEADEFFRVDGEVVTDAHEKWRIKTDVDTSDAQEMFNDIRREFFGEFTGPEELKRLYEECKWLKK